jgi:hypothetical protein
MKNTSSATSGAAAGWSCGDGHAFFSPNVGLDYWKEVEIPVGLVKSLVRRRRVRMTCTHRPRHNVRYYGLP